MEVAASIIAFVQAAAGAAKCIHKARELWKEVKGLPEEIQDIETNLELLEGVLGDLESQFNAHEIPSTFWDDSSAKRSLSLARTAHKILQEMVNDLSLQLSKKKGMRKKVAAAKAVLSKDALSRLQDRLRKSLDLVNMSINCFTMAWMRISPQLMAKQVTTEVLGQLQSKQPMYIESPANKTSHPLENHQTENEATQAMRSTKPASSVQKLGRFAYSYVLETGAWQVVLRTPDWISRKTYELRSIPTYSGWTWNFRVYSTVSSNSEIIKLVRRGDKNGVLQLFKTHQASPFDQDEQGQTLLHHATVTTQPDLCRFLLELGLGSALVDGTSQGDKSPLKSLVYDLRRHGQDPRAIQTAQVFLSRFRNDGTYPNIETAFDFIVQWVYGDEYVLIFVQNFIPEYYTGSLRVRLEAVRHGSFHVQHGNTLYKLLRQGESSFSENDIVASVAEKVSLLHSVAVAFGIRFADDVLPYRRAEFQWRVYNDDWADLITEVARFTDSAGLHSIETITPWDVYQVPTWRGSPLTSALAAALCYMSPDISFFYWDTTFQTTVHEWTRALQNAGVNLLEYGETEARVLKESWKGALDADAVEASRHEVRLTMPKVAQSARVEDVLLGGWNHNHWVPVRFIDIKFGPQPEDWEIIWAPEFEAIAHQFWNTGIHTEISMPGAWIE